MSQEQPVKMSLYRVTTRMSNYGSVDYSTSYVVAATPDEAYQKIRQFFFENKLGLTGDQELDTVTLMADTSRYPACRVRLYL